MTVHIGVNWLNASEVLGDFDSWMDYHAAALPKFDQATLFTKYHLAGAMSEDGSRKRLSGLANIKGNKNL